MDRIAFTSRDILVYINIVFSTLCNRKLYLKVGFWDRSAKMGIYWVGFKLVPYWYPWLSLWTLFLFYRGFFPDKINELTVDDASKVALLKMLPQKSKEKYYLELYIFNRSLRWRETIICMVYGSFGGVVYASKLKSHSEANWRSIVGKPSDFFARKLKDLK